MIRFDLNIVLQQNNTEYQMKEVTIFPYYYYYYYYYISTITILLDLSTILLRSNIHPLYKMLKSLVQAQNT